MQLIMKNSLYVLLFLLFSLSTFAQSAGRALSKGNEGYEGKHYNQAEASYRIANSKDAKSTADYNLGNTMYKQKLNKEAETAYLRAAQKATTKEAKHLAYHNLGNAYMKSKNYQAAEQAYKNALLNNPKDDETRYNYAVAKKMNKDNPQDNKDNKDQNKDQNKDNKDNQDQNKDNKDQDNKDNKDNQKDQKDKNDKGKDDQKDKDKNNKDQDKKDGDKDKDKGDKDNKDKNDKGDGEQPKQNNPNAPSKDQIDRILDAMNKDEKGVQQRLIDKNPKGGEKGKAAGQAEKRKKDW
ncbi:tetratricopeptide repeat protein [Myroides marinus]|uniref:tetratricopeptide repeat protein n=1 Tax=Myroides marinus TaxID=703342 RepID=UPI00257735E7|nr:tetratricopeptide repeat protein [Myroides marinus]MDM1367414.1 tetratricopeptide repeat protein [Myroides marinus]MDM1370994.1 tetratricopeptide repeat protein [Myroides marinus]MDM1373913.1 tetratricopeptide repeat protein [Myroides marinus]MDM1382935.1 tetratricopeptide repeat protein [Myroides marinus]MDM1388386.1 tetratricopeptide repeat protein [Myroides marinus]